MVANSNETIFNEIWNKLKKLFQLEEVLASAIGVQITTVLWIPVAMQLPPSSLSCLVTVIDQYERKFLLVAQYNVTTNAFVFANIELKPSEKIIAWAAIPRPYNSNSVF